MPIPIELRKAIDAANDSLYDWSARNNEEFTTVQRVAARWYKRTDRRPHGGISRRIIKKLRRDYPLNQTLPSSLAGNAPDSPVTDLQQ